MRFHMLNVSGKCWKNVEFLDLLGWTLSFSLLFFSPNISLRPPTGPRKKYTEISDISPISHLNFTRVKSAEFGLNFSSRPSLKTEQRIWNLKRVKDRWLAYYILPKFCTIRAAQFWEPSGPGRLVESSVYNNSASHCPILLKFGRPVHYGALAWKPRTNDWQDGWFQMAMQRNCHLL